MMTKKNILLLGGVGVLLFIVSALPEKFALCGVYDIDCIKLFENLAEITMIFVVVFLLSLAAYILPEKVFSSWVSFTKWWVPLTIALTILSGFGEQPSNMPGMIAPDTVSLFMTSLFLIISLIIIAYKFFTLKK